MPDTSRKFPRLSVNAMANYMVSGESARLRILAEAKNPAAFMTTRYRHARSALTNFLTDDGRNLSHLIEARERLERKAESAIAGALEREDARLSIDVIDAIQAMQNRLAPYDFHPAEGVGGKIDIEGVKISVQPDMLVYGLTRGREQIGAAVLRMTKDYTSGESSIKKRQEMGRVVATLARMHLNETNPTDREVANKLCLSIDVQFGEILSVPASNTRREKNIRAACQFIAAMWDDI